jgi:CHAD domain-containing protein
MRVATRRLRSALTVLKRVAAFPELAPLSAALRDTAARLGAARDWDVFLGGTAERIAAAFPDDPRVRALLAAARRRRHAAYAELRAYLASAAFRELEVGLACASVLRPWERQDTPDPRLQQDTAMFAGMALDHQMKRVRRAGRGLSTLPVEALHELRKDCKRLRYTAEFFLPLFPDKPARRFIKQLAALQEELGALNDGAVAAGLMAHLGRSERGYAAGLVGGFVAAGAMASRAHIGEAWKHFRKTPVFWT